MRENKYFLLFLCIIALSFASCSGTSKDNTEAKDENDSSFALSAEDNSLLDTLQYQTFQYFWDGALPNSGLAAERVHMDNVYPSNDKNTVTTGGSGFGLMAILVGVERGWITREQALERYEKAINFLENADRFHGAWPHWIHDESGKVKPFFAKDNGGDLVETAFLVQGMLTVAEYFKGGNEREQQLAEKIQRLYEEVEWDWYTQGGQNVLYWHWSPEYEFEINHKVQGYNECLIMYILAASSPTHPISKAVYDEGWARNGAITEADTLYNLSTVVKFNGGMSGPLFWAHYSYVGLNPTGLSDAYADYWKLNRNQALIHYNYCVDNPKGYKGYGENCWGLTASYSVNGYSAHSPGHDLGVISPTAALSSMPYTPKETMQFVRYLYHERPELIGEYGPYDAFSNEANWSTPRYLAIDQGPIPVMIENYRTGLLWNLFMQNDDVQNGLNKLGFKIKN